MSRQGYEVTYTIGRKRVSFVVWAESEQDAREKGYYKACNLRGTRNYQGAHIRFRSCEIVTEE